MDSFINPEEYIDARKKQLNHFSQQILMFFTRYLPLLVFFLNACSSATQGSSRGASPVPSSSSSTPNAIVTAPLPLPSSVVLASVGSGVPLDAPVADQPANDANVFVNLADSANTDFNQALMRGDDAYLRNDFAAAREAYETAAKLGPKNPAPIVGIVRSRLSAEKAPVEIASAPKHPGLEWAITELERALRLDAKFAPAHLELGRTFLPLGRMDEAVVALRKAGELAPANAEAHSAFGVALLATGEVQRALRELQTAVTFDSKSAVRQKNLGTVLLAAGRPADALVAFERAAELAPLDAQIQNDLGTALLTLGQTDRAIEHLLTAVKRDPRRPTYRSNLGYGMAQRGELDRAIVIYREALALDPKLGSAWINLGNALAKQGKFTEAREAYRHAEALDPTDPRVKAVIEELRAIEQPTTAPKSD